METLKGIIDKWSGPAGMMVLFGAIIWGVQLNIVTLRLTEEVAAIKGVQEQQQQEIAAVATEIAKTAAILEIVVDQLHMLESRMTRNESWIRENMERN